LASFREYLESFREHLESLRENALRRHGGIEEPSLLEGSGSPSNCEPPLGKKISGSINFFSFFGERFESFREHLKSFREHLWYYYDGGHPPKARMSSSRQYSVSVPSYDSTLNRIMHAMKMAVGTKKLTCFCI
jgi:hypothetical protein